MSNITSFDHRRKSLGELQKIVYDQEKQIEAMQDKLMWHESYIETMEVQFSEFTNSYKLMNEELLDSIKELHQEMMRLDREKI